MSEVVCELPVVHAWRRAGGRALRGVEAIRDKPELKTSIFRLLGAGDDGAPVMAKRCRRPVMEVEALVYGELLPEIPITRPRFYGSVAQDDAWGWIFLEDIGSDRLSAEQPTHRRLAASWLASLHLTAAAAPRSWAERLPARGPAHYRAHLHAARRGLRDSYMNPAFEAADRAVLDRALRHCDLLEAHWGELEAACASCPMTLVHGDFRPKNVHVRRAPRGLELFAIDWETAGWGPPVADLAPARGEPSRPLVDLATYQTAVRLRWPELDMPALLRLMAVGHVFRQLAALEWVSADLPFPWPEKPIARLGFYCDRLDTALRDTQWVA